MIGEEEKDVLPNYDIGIFRVVPTILSEVLKLDLEDPYSKYILPKPHKKLFEEKKIEVLIIADSISTNVLYGWLRDKWIEQGRLQLSSVFPTTTANAIGAIYIGLPPEINGLVSTKFYAREIGNYIDALRGWALGATFCDLELSGVRLSSLLWEPPILDVVDGEEIYFIDILPNFIRGGLQGFYNENLISITYETSLDAYITLEKTIETLHKRRKKGIIFLYLHNLDSFGHKYGYNSDEWRREYFELDKSINGLLGELEEKGFKNISIHLISDHGQINPSQEKVFDKKE